MDMLILIDVSFTISGKIYPFKYKQAFVGRKAGVFFLNSVIVTAAALLIPGVLAGFLQTIPKELEEAAYSSGLPGIHG